MFFKKKGKNIKCDNCNSSISRNYSFCPYCGIDILDGEKEAKDFGMLGRVDSSNLDGNNEGFGITDKLISSLMNSFMKNMDKQFREIGNMDGAEIKSLPNGIKIKIGPVQHIQKKENKAKRIELSDHQLKRIVSLPKAQAKSSLKRFSDKVVYEMDAPGIKSPEDIIVSKLESGYEIKAIGSKKVYVNSVQIDLPIKGFIIDNNKLLVEFKTQ